MTLISHFELILSDHLKFPKKITIDMNDVFIHQTATVDESASIGKGSKIWHYAHIRSSAVLGNNVIVGKSSYVDVDVEIGDNVKIQNLVSIYHGVQIADNVFIGPHVTFTNDLYPRALRDFEIISTKVEESVSIGANSTIICGITLGKFCLIAAGSVVTKSIPPHGLVAGNPAKLIGWVCANCAHKIANKSHEQDQVIIICENCHTENKFEIEEM